MTTRFWNDKIVVLIKVLLSNGLYGNTIKDLDGFFCNRFLRKEITKGEAINNYSSAQIIATNDWMNHYPRAMFNGHSSMDIYRKAFYQEISQLHQPIINWSVLFI